MAYRKFSPQFKLEIIREVEDGEKRVSQICREHSLSHPTESATPRGPRSQTPSSDAGSSSIANAAPMLSGPAIPRPRNWRPQRSASPNSKRHSVEPPSRWTSSGDV